MCISMDDAIYYIGFIGRFQFLWLDQAEWKARPLATKFFPRSLPVDSKLIDWAWEQRRKRRNGKLPPERIALLDQIGFHWENLRRRSSRGSQDYQSVWQTHIAELIAFKEEHGYTCVPQSSRFAAAPGLAKWVSNVRSSYRAGKLAPERIRQLEELGFNWVAIPPAWRNNYHQLKEWRSEHGHCNLPAGSRIRSWASNQREHRLLGKLQPEQIALLDAIGYQWDQPLPLPLPLALPRRTGHEARWQTRIAALTAYKAEHGHCNVPTSPTRRSSLGRWVMNVRSSYHRGKLAPERIRELEALGFRWRVRPTMNREPITIN